MVGYLTTSISKAFVASVWSSTVSVFIDIIQNVALVHVEEVKYENSDLRVKLEEESRDNQNE